ncbi:MAG: hypothetical protein RLZZ220_2596, partial [Pseudomonadota bacterium]
GRSSSKTHTAIQHGGTHQTPAGNTMIRTLIATTRPALPGPREG